MKGIKVNDVDLEEYIDQKFLSKVKKEITPTPGYNQKPHLRYKEKQEPPGIGRSLTQAEINKQYLDSIVEELLRNKSPKIDYIYAALLSGEIFTAESMIAFLKARKIEVNTQFIHSTISAISRSPASFILIKNQRRPRTYQLDTRVLDLKVSELRKLVLEKRPLEQLLAMYPFLVPILEEQQSIKMPIPKVPTPKEPEPTLEKPDFSFGIEDVLKMFKNLTIDISITIRSKQ